MSGITPTSETPTQKGQVYELFYGAGDVRSSLTRAQKRQIRHYLENWEGGHLVVDFIEELRSGGGFNVVTVVTQGGRQIKNTFPRNLVLVPYAGPDSEDYIPTNLQSYELTGSWWGPIVDAKAAAHNAQEWFGETTHEVLEDAPRRVGEAAGDVAQGLVEGVTGVQGDAARAIGLATVAVFVFAAVAWIVRGSK